MIGEQFQSEIGTWLDKRYALVTPEQELQLGQEGMQKLIVKELSTWLAHRQRTAASIIS